MVSLAMAKLWHDIYKGKIDNFCADGKIDVYEKRKFADILIPLIKDFSGYIGKNGTYLNAWGRNDILKKHGLEAQELSFKDIVSNDVVNRNIFRLGPIVYRVRNHLGYVGHYMLIVGYDEEKGFIINDPSGRDIIYVKPQSLNCGECKFFLIKEASN